MKQHIIKTIFTVLLLLPTFAFADSFVVDGTTPANSTGPCVGKTVCHISGDLTYSNITLQNGAKLSHRQGTLTVVNDFIIGSGSSSYFVGQNLNVGHQLKITNASVLALNSNLTSEPTSTNIVDWSGLNYYDLQVTNTDTSFEGLDINISSSSCLTGGGGGAMTACIITRNAIINSKFKLSSGVTNVLWKTYADGYMSIDGDANITNINMDIDGYMYVGGNLNHSTAGSASYYFNVRGDTQISTPLSTEFTSAGMQVNGNMAFTGHTTTPTQFYFYATSGTAGDNVYASGSIDMYKMQIGTGSITSGESLGTIESRYSNINISSTNNIYSSANLKAYSNINLADITTISLQDITSTNGDIIKSNITSLTSRDIISIIGNITNQGTWTTHIYRHVIAKQDISLTRSSLGGTLTTNNLTNSGTTLLQNITTYNRNGNILTTGDITLNNITTSSGITTDITSTLGNILIQTGTTHTYRDIRSKLNTTFTNITTNTTNDITSTDGTVTTTTGTNHTYRDITAGQNINISSIGTKLTTRNLSNSGTTILNTITTYDRLGNILTSGNITLNNITTSSGSATNITSTLGNIGITTGTTHTYNNITAKGNISVDTIGTSLLTKDLTNSGTTTLQNILLHNRDGNILTTGDITLNNITTSSGSSTNVTSTAGKITVTTGTTHTYNNVTSYSDNTITSIVSYKANNISSNAKLTVSGSTIEITNTTDEWNEGAPNIDIATGGDFTITNSTGNLAKSSIQVNGALEIDNTAWVSQNLNINGYKTLSTEKVGIYFRNGKDRYIHGNIFAGGGSIWVGTSGVPDNGNILLHRNAQISTNGGLKVYRDVSTHTDRFAFAPTSTITVNSGIFSQLYNGALASNSGSITGSGTWTSVSNIIDGNTSNAGNSSTIGASFEITLARTMTLSKVCITADGTSPSNIKMQFKENGTNISNTQNIKIQSVSSSRQCFDINTTKARKVSISGYPDLSIGFKEVEVWGVPTDVANVSASLNDDIILSNGSYEIGGNITSKNLNITSTSSKKFRLIQYSSNGVFDAKSTLNLSNTTSGNTLITHSVGNELGLKFVTDAMSIGTGVLVDTSNKGYLGGKATSQFSSKYGTTGNITPGTSPLSAGNGGNYGGVGGYGVSGGGGGGADYLSLTGVGLGDGHSCGVNNGILYCWGKGTDGQVGNGATGSTNTVPLKVSAGEMTTNTSISQSALGKDHTCTLKSGVVYCFGKNTLGQIGQHIFNYNIFGSATFGTAQFKSTIIKDSTKPIVLTGGVMSNSSVTKVSAGGNKSCAIRSGVLYCWGESFPGELYSFSSHTFTNCGATGQNGPSLGNCRSTYSTTGNWDEDNNFFNQGLFQGYQLWTVPKTGIYTINAKGAKGGNSNDGLEGGYGAIMQGNIELIAGEKIIIVTTQQVKKSYKINV